MPPRPLGGFAPPVVHWSSMPSKLAAWVKVNRESISQFRLLFAASGPPLEVEK